MIIVERKCEVSAKVEVDKRYYHVSVQHYNDGKNITISNGQTFVTFLALDWEIVKESVEKVLEEEEIARAVLADV